MCWARKCNVLCSRDGSSLRRDLDRVVAPPHASVSVAHGRLLGSHTASSKLTSLSPPVRFSSPSHSIPRRIAQRFCKGIASFAPSSARKRTMGALKATGELSILRLGLVRIQRRTSGFSPFEGPLAFDCGVERPRGKYPLWEVATERRRRRWRTSLIGHEPS
jgi:hypothetical protein